MQWALCGVWWGDQVLNGVRVKSGSMTVCRSYLQHLYLHLKRHIQAWTVKKPGCVSCITERWPTLSSLWPETKRSLTFSGNCPRIIEGQSPEYWSCKKCLSWLNTLNKQTLKPWNTVSYCFTLYVADPATLLASDSVLGPLFSSENSFERQSPRINNTRGHMCVQCILFVITVQH